MKSIADTLAHADPGRIDVDASMLLNTALAVELASNSIESTGAAPVSPRLRERLLDRVHRSAVALRGFIPVRHGDTPWTDTREGVRTRRLHDDGALRRSMLELQPGTALPHAGDADAQEILVLRGTLTGQALLGPQSFLLRSSAAPGAWTAPQGALLYVRELCGPRETLPAAEARWWPAAGAAAIIVAASDDGWQPFSLGVQVKPLAGSDEAISMLARFQPGARVARHSHGLPEDCVMVQGDLFLGDQLMREGEYQLAPAGTEHDGVLSDHGSVLYFHGAIAAELRGGA